MKLSILDLLPLRKGRSSIQALSANRSLVEKADALGYARYWFAGYHNTTAEVTIPAILIALAITRTDKIRLGSRNVV